MPEACICRRLVSPWGDMWLAASPQGLVWLTLPGDAVPDGVLLGGITDAPERADSPDMAAATRHIEQGAALLARYFDGEPCLPGTPCTPDMPELALDLHGTPFTCAVWQALRQVGWGCTASYGAIAHRIGRPRAARAVGMACGRNPLPILVPCHRIVGASGSLTGFSGGLALKQALLAHEGHVLQQGTLTG